MQKYNSREEVPEKYKWNLTDFFKKEEDFNNSLNKCTKEISNLKSYIGCCKNPSKLYEFLSKEIETIALWEDLYVYSYLSVNEIPDNVPGYFIYDSSKDYAALFKEINKKIVAGNDDEYDSYEEYISKLVKPFEDEGYNTKDVECPSVKPSEGIVKREDFGDIEFRGWNPYCGGGDIIILREDIEARFDDSISDCYCVIQLKNKKENIIVNPETASTIGIICLITLGSIGFITAKKLRKNN